MDSLTCSIFARVTTVLAWAEESCEVGFQLVGSNYLTACFGYSIEQTVSEKDCLGSISAPHNDQFTHLCEASDGKWCREERFFGCGRDFDLGHPGKTFKRRKVSRCDIWTID